MENNNTNQVYQLDGESLKGLISNAILETTKALGMDKVDRRFGVFPETSLDELKTMSKDDRIKSWLKAIWKKDPMMLAQVKALSEGTGSAGGYLVPEEFRLEVIREAELYGILRKNAFTFPTSTDTVHLNNDAGSVSVAWTSENSQISASAPTLAETVLYIKKAAGITALSNELLDDAQFPIVQYLATLFGEEIAKAEDTQGLTGTGSPFTGLIGGLSNINTYTMTSTSIKDISADDLLQLALKVSAKYRQGASYVMHPTVFSYIRQQKSSGSGEYIVQQPIAPNQSYTLWGYPVLESEVMPSTDASGTAFVGFANIGRRCYFADRKQLSVAIGTEGTVGSDNLFEKDMSAVRVTERVGIAWILGAGCSQLKTA